MTTTSLSRTTPAAGTEPKGATTNARRARTRRRWLGRGAWAFVGIAGAIGLAYAWRPKPIAVDLATVTRGDLVVSVDEVGKTRVRDRYVVAAPLAGNLMRIELKPGDKVREDAVVARIAPMEAPLLDPRTRAEAVSRSDAASAGERQSRAAIDRAELASKHANDDLERVRRLAESGSISQDTLLNAELEARLRREELASARFGAQVASHEAAMTRAALARFGAAAASREGFDVSAPISGTVLRVPAQSAGPVQPGTPLIELGDPSALEIVTEVLSADAVRITPGAKVVLERWGGAPLNAHVRRVEPSGFTRLSALGVEEQRVPVVVDLDEPREKWATLGDGYRVEARIVIEEKHGILRVPIGAVFRQADGWGVYASRDGRAKLVPVTLGAKSDVDVEISSGLAERDAVVVHPGEKVKEGVMLAAR
jgi:HlyD family secretion protein